VSVLDSITEFCFVCIMTGEDVVNKGVKNFDTGTFSANEQRG
jgi:hypothetical protein